MRGNMFQRIKDWMFRVWDQRFIFGAAVALGDIGLTRFSNNEFMIGGHLLTVMSTGTGHWPWYLAEFGWSSGSRGSWHLGLLGFTIGMCMVHVTDTETGEVVGPDKRKFYSFFKGINHKQKQLEEII
jgi:hypothetical protein